MRIRAFLLIAILIGGTYMMLESIDENKEKEFFELLDSDNEFDSLTFNKPARFGTDSKTWIIDEQEEIQTLTAFLEQYRFQKLQPDEIDPHDEIDEFSISLHNENGQTISIIVTEDLIIQNSSLYYEIVGGPLNIDWLVHFFVSNQN